MWTRTRCIAGAGRSPRSPGTWDMTARPSAPTCPAGGSPASAVGIEPDPFEPFAGYCRERLVEDPHLWATTLFDELLELGYDRSYPTFTRQLRARGLRPACEPCRPAKDRPVAVIEHPPGEESSVRLAGAARPTRAVGLGVEGVPAGRRFGALRAVARGAGRVHRPAAPDRRLAPGLRRAGWADPHLAVRPDGHRLPPGHRPDHRLVRRGRQAITGCRWRSARPRRGNRKGVVEKANHTAAQRWWRTLADECSPEQAQTSLGPVVSRCAATPACARPATGRPPWPPSPRASRWSCVPAPFPAVLAVERIASAQALVAFRGNRYSVPPELARAQITVSHRLGATHIELATGGGIVIARHAARPGRGRRHRPRHRARPGPGARGDGRVHRRRAAPAQAAHPTRPGRPGRR